MTAPAVEAVRSFVLVKSVTRRMVEDEAEEEVVREVAPQPAAKSVKECDGGMKAVVEVGREVALQPAAKRVKE